LGFTCFFAGELLIRLCAQRLYFFVKPRVWKWHLFDAVLVAISIAQEIFENVPNWSFARLLRIFRLVRVMRLLRVFRQFRELRKMTLSILACIVSLTWAVVLLLVINFVFSLIFMQGAASHLEGNENIDSELLSGLKKWYPNLGRTMFSLLLAITGGTDWLLIAKPLMSIHWLYEVAFTFYILFVVIGVVNVLTGVFLENAAEIGDRELVIHSQVAAWESFAHEMTESFGERGADEDGYVSRSALLEHLSSRDMVAYLEAHNLDIHSASELIGLIDNGDTGRVRLVDFVAGMFKLRGFATQVHVSTVERKLANVDKKINLLAEQLTQGTRGRYGKHEGILV